MDLIIKNIEQLKYFQDKMNPKTITIDVEKMIEGHEDFYNIFKKSCKVYKHEEPKIRDIEECKTCKHWTKNLSEEPCHSCYLNDEDHYEPAEPTIKEATEHMQSEWDATGKDVKVFMNERVIKR